MLSTRKSPITTIESNSRAPGWTVWPTLSFSRVIFRAMPFTEKEFKQMGVAQQWNEDDVCKWLENISMGQYATKFKQNYITGNELLMLQPANLKEIGVDKVGHRIRILEELSKSQQIMAVAQRHAEIMTFTKFYWIPALVVFPLKYKLTPSRIEIEQKRPFGTTHEQIDMEAVKDIQLDTTCCFSVLTVVSTDPSHGTLRIPLSAVQAPNIYQTLKRTWEADQVRMARGR